MSRALVVTAAFVLGLMPDIALACPTCFAGVENRTEYFLTFVLMTVLPLASIGAILYWLRLKFREAKERELRGDR